MVLQVVSIAGGKEGLCYPQFYKNKGPVKRNLDVETKKNWYGNRKLSG